MKTFVTGSSLLLVLLLWAPSSEASPILTYEAIMNPVPAGGASATGRTIVTIDLEASLMVFDMTWSGLAGSATGMHVHCCPIAGNTPLAITSATLGGPAFPTGTSGSYLRTFDLLDASSPIYAPAFLSARNGSVAQAKADLLASLAAGTAFAETLSSRVPAGELRGTLVPVPEPGSMTLVGMVLTGLALRRRRARRT